MLSLVSYPKRGDGGSASYRGNCAPQIVEELIDHYRWSELSDYMCGSGTVEDVCLRKGVTPHCYDLNRGFDLVAMEIPERNEAVFWHPPYGDMIRYSGNMYSEESVRERYGISCENDLSRIREWPEFVRVMNYCCMKQYASLEPGGRLAVLMGDMRRKGRYYSMLLDIAKPGEVESIVIKAQHNCQSYGRRYSGAGFIPIVHEYLMVLRKVDGLLHPVALPRRVVLDVRDMRRITWRDLLCDLMRSMGPGPHALPEIYSMVSGHRRCEGVSDWRAKVRQTLQCYPQFASNGDGCWMLAA